MHYRTFLNNTIPLLSYRRKFQIFCLLFASLVASVIEILAVASIIPFLSYLNDGAQSKQLALDEMLKNFISLELNITHYVLIFIFLTILANLSRVLILIAQTRLSQALGLDFSKLMFLSILTNDYSWQLKKSSAENISNITIKINNVVTQFINPLFEAVLSSIILLTLVMFLVYLQPKIVISVLVIYGVLYLIAMRSIRGRLSLKGEQISKSLDDLVSQVGEVSALIKSIIIFNKQQYFFESFMQTSRVYRRLVGDVSIYALVPRYIFEAIGIIVVACALFVVTTLQGQSFMDILPFFGAFALAGQRVMPLMQRIYISLTLIRASVPQLSAISSYVEREFSNNKSMNIEDPENHQFAFLSKRVDASSLKFQKSIELRDVEFLDVEGNRLLSNVSMKIDKNSILGIKGHTGSGKTSLLNIILLLLKPSNGQILLDGIEINAQNQDQYQQLFSLVSQENELPSLDIISNVGFADLGGKVRQKAVKKAARLAKVSHLLNRNEGEQYENTGLRLLSGGEKQRLNIARSLYANRDVMVLDELSSALDKKTEAQIIQYLKTLKYEKTLIIVSHSKEVLAICDRVYEIHNGQVKLVNS